MSSATYADLIEQDYDPYLQGLLAGDSLLCAEIARRLRTAGVGVPELYVNLFQRALYDIGTLWEKGRISVAVEHLATAITQRLITLFHSDIFGGPRHQRSVIIACVEGERHQLGGRMIADLFEMNGWRGDFLGSDTPPDDLVSMINSRRPDMLGLSVSIAANMPALLKTLDVITAAHPELPILVGGQAFQGDGCRILAAYRHVTCVVDNGQLQEILASRHG